MTGFDNMGKAISVLGCGWLGFPLAEYLIDNGWSVKGSTTSVEKLAKLDAAGIKPFLLDISKSETLDAHFFNSDFLVVNIPPSSLFRDVETYWPLIKTIEESELTKVIFISSTSVYPSHNQIAYEDDTEIIKDGENALLDIERAFQSADFDTTVIRFGGLVGGVRYPGRFFAAGKELPGANQPVNLIHLDDCIQIIERVLDKDYLGQVFNGVADSHPSRMEFYSLAATLNGQQLLNFNNENEAYKIISNKKTKRLLDISFKHPDLLEMLKDDSLWNRT
ncbi:NAD(P)H-binding protein [Carboxylicivirga sp. A043]|uniref:NAD(P)H-binding protein n=1 Tax=Carboxylicivirga litoralis TaxID=2816963 RepID=UPI0021CB53DE|nr:NAD(P)H-binding protein [Carboxylicivirga sp. A043]MCU4154887.1 NAD(P)H-binding protein [Carboxylicivirga sp. A043]